MKQIFVNLKRFDVPKSLGGICPEESPEKWIRDTVRQSVGMGLGRIEGVTVTYFLPEALLLPALEELGKAEPSEVGRLFVGSQNVFRQDVQEGKNFGAFTSNRPAAAMKALGCGWSMIGHSEERRDKLEMMELFAQTAGVKNAEPAEAAAVDILLNQEIRCALERGISVLYCIGETEQQKGSDDPAIYEDRVRAVLKDQLVRGLQGTMELLGDREIVIGYEPIWAIGPGKTPPNGDYISFVSDYIQKVCREEFGYEINVVYGGGLKEENAREVASVSTIGGGLVALTKFTQPIAFDVESLRNIILAYIQ